ncbi:hypothetical protein FHR75_000012 [Kineococcus radiotolerans]|uniref:DUF4166 domain-containing protein n=1 Tax=Kineococcus radiotolerans TaxID=131568 RepID=A0A7W4XVI7_KINRA|nr:DUF4166 domain-containing protein [Kineococcus radiotolerans]MBB2899224.1 hypothetical protein [Kineococcus radiotolerans]
MSAREPDFTGSVVLAALGADAARLHPMLQRRFGVSTAAGYSCVGRGVMDRLWHGPAWTLPFLHLGAWRNILVPDAGSDVPFSVENYAYVDSFGRETVTVVRTFEIAPSRRRRFDATLVADGPGRVLDYLGTHQHLAVDLRPSVLADGRLRIVSSAQRFYEGRVAFRFPMLFSGTAELIEGYDEARGRYTIEVAVSNERFGPLAGYSGSFTCEFPPVVGDAVPPAVRPLREEQRR